jgi:hypothetical protein
MGQPIQQHVKTFAWRLLRLALGTATRVHKKIPWVHEACSRCGNIEDEKHLFFECSFARAVWFASSIGLRANALPSSGRGLHIQIATILQQEPSQATIGMIFSIMWCLWKARNDLRLNNLNWSTDKSVTWGHGHWQCLQFANTARQWVTAHIYTSAQLKSAHSRCYHSCQ